MRNNEKQELAEIQKDIKESQQDIEKMLKEMEGYEQIFTDAAQWLPASLRRPEWHACDSLLTLKHFLSGRV